MKQELLSPFYRQETEAQRALLSGQGYRGICRHNRYRFWGFWSCPLALQHDYTASQTYTTYFYTLKVSFVFLFHFFLVISPSADPICHSLVFIHTVCVLPLYTPQLPRNSHSLPTFFPRDFPFPPLPTSCSPICSKKTGRLSCLLVSIFACSCCLQ